MAFVGYKAMTASVATALIILGACSSAPEDDAGGRQEAMQNNAAPTVSWAGDYRLSGDWYGGYPSIAGLPGTDTAIVVYNGKSSTHVWQGIATATTNGGDISNVSFSGTNVTPLSGQQPAVATTGTHTLACAATKGAGNPIQCSPAAMEGTTAAWGGVLSSPLKANSCGQFGAGRFGLATWGNTFVLAGGSPDGGSVDVVFGAASSDNQSIDWGTPQKIASAPSGGLSVCDVQIAVNSSGLLVLGFDVEDPAGSGFWATLGQLPASESTDPELKMGSTQQVRGDGSTYYPALVLTDDNALIEVHGKNDGTHPSVLYSTTGSADPGSLSTSWDSPQQVLNAVSGLGLGMGLFANSQQPLMMHGSSRIGYNNLYYVPGTIPQ